MFVNTYQNNLNIYPYSLILLTFSSKWLSKLDFNLLCNEKCPFIKLIKSLKDKIGNKKTRNREDFQLSESNRILQLLTDSKRPSSSPSLSPPPYKQDPLLRQLIAEASVADHEFLEAPSKQDQTFSNLIRRLQRLEAS